MWHAQPFFFFSSDVLVCDSVLAPRPSSSPITWPGHNKTQVSPILKSCLVEAWSSLHLAWPYSIGGPDPHRVCSCCSTRCERSDGRHTGQYGCVWFIMHAFWMARSTFCLALFFAFGFLGLIVLHKCFYLIILTLLFCYLLFIEQENL